MHEASPYRERPEGTRPFGLLFHKRNRAVFRTHRTQAQFIQAVVEDPLTREADHDPFPYPPPPDGAPFLYSLRGGVALQLRHYSSPIEWNSPIVEFHFEDEGKSTLVRVEFCPYSHNWGPPYSYSPEEYVDGHAIISVGHRLNAVLGRFIGRRVFRQQFIALIDRHCISGRVNYDDELA